MAARSFGMQEKDADAFAGILKSARYHEEVEDSTFWSRNKNWLIPAIVGSIAFYVGADGRIHGRADRGKISNSASRLWDRIGTFLGMNETDPLVRSSTISSEKN